MMKIIFILFLFYNYFIGVITFNCVNSSGTYANTDNYQSYYVCENSCAHLEYCSSSTPYFLPSTQKCFNTPIDWIPRYYLSGTRVIPEQFSTVLYVQQDGYKLLWTYDHPTKSETFTGQYINETYAQGIHIRRVLSTNCINVFNVEIIASADRTYCGTHSLHPQSALCDLYYPYVFSYCRTLSF